MNCIKNCINSWHVLVRYCSLDSPFSFKTHEEFHKQKNQKELLLYIMLHNKPGFKHRQSKWYWERILTVTNDFSGICRRNLKRSKNQTMSLQSLQGLSQSTMQLCQIFHTWRYVLQVDGILRSICCNMSSTAFHTIHSRNAATNKLQVPSQRKNWRWYLHKHLPINKCY